MSPLPPPRPLHPPVRLPGQKGGRRGGGGGGNRGCRLTGTSAGGQEGRHARDLKAVTVWTINLPALYTLLCSSVLLTGQGNARCTSYIGAKGGRDIAGWGMHVTCILYTKQPGPSITGYCEALVNNTAKTSCALKGRQLHTSLSACQHIHEGGFASPSDPHEAGEHLGPECTVDAQQQLQPGRATLQVHMGSVLGTVLGYGHPVVQLLEGHGHGLKGQHHTLALQLLPSLQMMTGWSVVSHWIVTALLQTVLRSAANDLQLPGFKL